MNELAPGEIATPNAKTSTELLLYAFKFRQSVIWR